MNGANEKTVIASEGGGGGGGEGPRRTQVPPRPRCSGKSPNRKRFRPPSVLRARAASVVALAALPVALMEGRVANGLQRSSAGNRAEKGPCPVGGRSTFHKCRLN